MVDPQEFDRIKAELTLANTLIGECVNDFINLRINRKTFDERIARYADRIEAARRDEDKLLQSFDEIIRKIQEHTDNGTPAKPKARKKK